MIMPWLLAALLGANSPTAEKVAPKQGCAYAAPWRLTNIPISPPSPATDIIHAVAVRAGGHYIGYVFVLRDGVSWYQDGPVGGPIPPHADSMKALRAIGFTKSVRTGVGEMIIRKDISLTRLMMSGLQVFSCY